MHDAVRLESAGIPTAVVITTVFEHEARVQREALGMNALDPIVVEHPLSTLSEAQLDARAQSALDGVVRAWRRV